MILIVKFSKFHFFGLFVVRCAIWYHSRNLKNVKNTHGGVLHLVLKETLLHGCFSRFLNCTHGTKSRNALHLRDNGGKGYHCLCDLFSLIGRSLSILQI